jgi:uncharacterized membrane protein SpoIIM required for sporulation
VTKSSFLEKRREIWRRFELLLARLERVRPRRLSGADASRFSRLFRAICYDLATVRSRDWGRDLETYLNDLARRGHNAFYRAPPGRVREIGRFFTHDFPALLRKNARYFWTAVALYVIPLVVTAVLIGRDVRLAERILPATDLAAYERMYTEAPGQARRASDDTLMAGFYIYNNIGIAFECFATGILFGIGTVFVLVFNGIYHGAVAGFIIAKGNGALFFNFVVAHSAFELTAVVIAGAAGLMLGHAIVHPGRYTRLEALRRRGFDAVRLAAGAAAMLAIAALIEGFWSPKPIPSATKMVAGGILWTLVIVYLGLAGRDGIER